MLTLSEWCRRRHALVCGLFKDVLQFFKQTLRVARPVVGHFGAIVLGKRFVGSDPLPLLFNVLGRRWVALLAAQLRALTGWPLGPLDRLLQPLHQATIVVTKMIHLLEALLELSLRVLLEGFLRDVLAEL